MIRKKPLLIAVALIELALFAEEQVTPLLSSPLSAVLLTAPPVFATDVPRAAVGR